ncbi:MAG TPA: tRNA (guanosine(37)-N1)-methyltransferase TrmD [Saprospiraceae bacterium]|jgi:tRNA (guanine37-N1)-methyltransferase|nr:tRNA (guanosine(37)-N1)-methyltransferase TrmD [Saprospiraceae bacterium]HRG43683.1 tRNA (guanosine(37)-N1)-methyltransferase TrmD [Saprospiraceae bacterium]
MRIDIIAVIPDLMVSFFNNSIVKNARTKGLLNINIFDLRDYGLGNYKQIDDYPYGGQSGMVLMPEPLSRCIEELSSNTPYEEVIYLTPDGETFNQKAANSLSLKENILIICGHYKGIDQRIRDMYVTREISIGDYVLSGGETAAMVLVDAIGRLIPGVISDETSALSDTFQDDLLSAPIYTRPAEFKGHKVPDILLSGHEKNIKEWQTQQMFEKTKKLRPDLYSKWQDESDLPV